VLVIPGDRDGDERCAQGRVITLRAPRVPFTGGYRVLWRRLVRVPLGVDLDTFSPRVRRVRTQYVGEGQILLVHCGRLSAEKRPQRLLTTLATLCAAGLPVRLVVAGDFLAAHGAEDSAAIRRRSA
jgi:glycosyltransferase involved in cell wall biosynthesis